MERNGRSEGFIAFTFVWIFEEEIYDGNMNARGIEETRYHSTLRWIASKSWLEDCAKFKIIVPPKMRTRTTLVSLQNNFLKLFDFCFDFDGTIRFYN